MKVVFSPKVLEFDSPGHPESSRRIQLIYNKLSKFKKFQFVPPNKILEKDLLLVHDKSLIKAVKENSFFDADTPNIPNIYQYALTSVSCAVTASQIALTQNYAFSLSRPPGHHATKTRVGGFCYFNNIAIATARLLKQGKKVAILDIDVHHGNGTQDIFLGIDELIYCSLHQYPLYPQTGYNSVKNCYNYPLPAETGFTLYKKFLKEAILKIISFHPNIVGVSLGFDTYINDPLAMLKLEIDDYQKIGSMIKDLNLPTFFILEGGYSQDLGKLALSFFSDYL